jgi:NAD(P)-dependent dehydrogenase (short-subunit alcohol dehydrogenase family)
MADGTDVRTVLITGAAGGLGTALALALAARGWRILAHGRDRSRGEALCERLRHAGAPFARYFEADLSSLAEAAGLADEVLASESSLDLLINNAGVGLTGGRAGGTPPTTWEVNYLAPYLLIRKLAPLMEGAADAQIVNIASAGQFPLDLRDGASPTASVAVPLYGQSKLAMIMATIALAPALAARRIRINAIHPATLMDTPMTAELATLEMRGLLGRLLKRRLRPRCTADDGAGNVLRLIDDPARPTGAYYKAARPGRAKRQAYDDRARGALLALSEQTCGAFLQPAV